MILIVLVILQKSPILNFFTDVAILYYKIISISKPASQFWLQKIIHAHNVEKEYYQQVNKQGIWMLIQV